MSNYTPVWFTLPESSLKSYSNALLSGVSDYMPFESIKPATSWVADSMGYRYGFKSMEKDDELKGSGNSYDFGARIYDSRVGRFFSRDFYSTFNVNHSPYSFCLNSPITLVDVDGDLNTIYIYVAKEYNYYGQKNSIK